MAITYVGSGKGLDDSGTASSLTVSYTSSAGLKRKLLVFVCWNDSTTQRTVSGVTYGGNALTRVAGASAVAGTSPSWTSVDTWYLDDASFPAPGASNVVATLSGTAPRVRLYVVEISGAAQGAPEAATVTTYTTASSNPTNSITTVAANALVITAAPGNVNTTISGYGTGQTERQRHDAVNLATGVTTEPVATPRADTQSITYVATASRGAVASVSIAPASTATIPPPFLMRRAA